MPEFVGYSIETVFGWNKELVCVLGVLVSIILLSECADMKGK